MGDSVLSDFNPIAIQSHRHEYHVNVVSDCTPNLKKYLELGCIFVIDSALSKFKPDLYALIHNAKLIEIQASEAAKSFDKVALLIEDLSSLGASRSLPIVVIGGGTTQDIASFAASILKRGINWVFFPTSFPAQCDSCIGSKTSINFGVKKNLLGTFFPPVDIFIDVSFIQTLPLLELKAGFGEILHYFCFAGEEKIALMETLDYENLSDRKILEKFIFESLNVKRRLIEIDEFDKDRRIVFNFGHTFGHALESISHYTIPHGIAVARGIDIANYVSYKRGWLDKADYERVQNICSQITDGADFGFYNVEKMFAAFKHDKKSTTTGIKFIYMHKLGDLRTYEETLNEEFVELLASYPGAWRS